MFVTIVMLCCCYPAGADFGASQSRRISAPRTGGPQHTFPQALIRLKGGQQVAAAEPEVAATQVQSVKTQVSQAEGRASGGGCTPGQMEEVSSEMELQTILDENKDKLVVLDFTAGWCAPCKQIAPFVSQLCEDNPSCIFVKIDADKVRPLMEKYKVTALPTFKFIKGGLVVHTIRGGQTGKLEGAVESLQPPPPLAVRLKKIMIRRVLLPGSFIAAAITAMQVERLFTRD